VPLLKQHKKTMRTNTNSGVISVQISRFGQNTVSVEVAQDSTVGDVLDTAGISLSGNEKLFCAGVEAALSDLVDAGDVLSVITPKQAGSK
jgi:hypothetical protein